MLTATYHGRTISIPDEERQQCEIWTRVMGYYRPISEFNIGKKQEARERKYFKIRGGTVSDEKQPDNYDSLRRVLMNALEQASHGKGHVRHGDERPFEEQISAQITKVQGIGYPLGQAMKKIAECRRLPDEVQQTRELYGAINMIALAILDINRG